MRLSGRPPGAYVTIAAVDDERSRRNDFQARSFIINVVLELADSGHVLHQASPDSLAHIRTSIEHRAVSDARRRFVRHRHLPMSRWRVPADAGERRATPIGASRPRHTPECRA